MAGVGRDHGAGQANPTMRVAAAADPPNRNPAGKARIAIKETT